MPERFNCVVLSLQTSPWISGAVIEGLADALPGLERRPASVLRWNPNTKRKSEEPWDQAKAAIPNSLADGDLLHVYFPIRNNDPSNPARVSVGLERSAAVETVTISLPRSVVLPPTSEGSSEIALQVFAWARAHAHQLAITCGQELELVGDSASVQRAISATFASDLFELGVIHAGLASLLPHWLATERLDREYLLVRTGRPER